MSNLRNRVQLIGNPGMDPEVKVFDNGNKLAKFALATNESYRNGKGERISETQWHNLVAWGKTAEIVEKFIKKGKEVGITGKLTTRNYDTEDGQKRYLTEIVIQEIVLLGNKEA